MQQGIQTVAAFRWQDQKISLVSDDLAVEEPLEIRLEQTADDGRIEGRSLAITMRTPNGDDRELVAGFLVSEGLLKDRQAIASIEPCGPEVAGLRNIIKVRLAPGVIWDLSHVSRNFYTTSSCGVCGKASLEALQVAGAVPLTSSDLRVASEIILGLSERALTQQGLFLQTGGLHGAALFDGSGRLLDLREDVGRHNAVDKVIGRAFLTGAFPLDDKVLFLSGRAGFELVQKALVARIPIVAAVGAPSSLAVALAAANQMTLIGFLRSGRFNIYTTKDRIIQALHPEDSLGHAKD